MNTNNQNSKSCYPSNKNNKQEGREPNIMNWLIKNTQNINLKDKAVNILSTNWKLQPSPSLILNEEMISRNPSTSNFTKTPRTEGFEKNTTDIQKVKKIPYIKSHYTKFSKKRLAEVYKIQIEENRVENLLIKLCNNIKKERKEDEENRLTGIVKSIKRMKNKESHKVVYWQKDVDYPNCSNCRIRFGILNKRHHCRICGYLVCGDQKCSVQCEIGFIEESNNNNDCGTKTFIVACTECVKTIKRIKRKRTNQDTSNTIISLHKILSENKKRILNTLPSFNKSLFELRNKQQLNIEDTEYVRALALKKKVLEHFKILDNLKTQLALINTSSLYENRIISIAKNDIYNFITENRITLAMIPPVKTENNKVDTLEHKTSVIDNAQLEFLMKLNIYEQQRDILSKLLVQKITQRNLDSARTIKISIDELDDEIKNIKTEIETKNKTP